LSPQADESSSRTSKPKIGEEETGVMRR